jgi:hypothetical protein
MFIEHSIYKALVFSVIDNAGREEGSQIDTVTLSKVVLFNSLVWRLSAP